MNGYLPVELADPEYCHGCLCLRYFRPNLLGNRCSHQNKYIHKDAKRPDWCPIVWPDEKETDSLTEDKG